MKLQRLFAILLWILVGALFINGQKPVNPGHRRRLHRHNCSLRRCLPLHSRVPFP
ncbi:apelin receptor early endogenous ligand [Lissotriton helveticus]